MWKYEAHKSSHVANELALGALNARATLANRLGDCEFCQ